MPEASYPYTGGQGITDASYEQLMAEVTGNGRIGLRNAGQALNVPIIYADSSGRQAKVRANSSYLIRGFRWDSNEGQVRSLDANASGNPRLDLFVLRLDRTNFTVRVEILKGTPASTPTLPAVTQQLGSTGRYEIPLASVRVNNGATNIISSDVTTLETWHAMPSQVGHSSNRPTQVDPGSLWTEYDTGRTYAGLQSSLHLIGEPGSLTKIDAHPTNWDPDKDNVYVHRRNGWTFFQAIVYRKTNAADLAADAPAHVVQLAEQYRPLGNFYADASMGGPATARIYYDATSGNVTLLDHPVMKPGTFLHVGPHSWPSR
jgi:hypothetical protein